MKKKRKICFVLVNRANYGRVRSLMIRLKDSKYFELQTVLISSTLLKKYGSLVDLVRKDGIKINFQLFNHIEGENLYTMTKSTGLALLDLSSAFQRLKPDMIFTIGDRYETLSTAITASFLNIFLVHLQGGELTGSIDEVVRHSITKLSNLHLVATKKSRKRVIQMGENPKSVLNVGCPSIDIIKKINFSTNVDLKKYKFGVGDRVELKKPYYVVLLHPVTTDYENNKNLIKETIEAIKKLNNQIVWLWPNNDAGSNFITNKIRTLREKKINLKINFYINFEVNDYLKLISKCKCLIGNSSSGIRESSYLGVPVVNIGDRQNFRERGKNIIDVDIDSNKILKAIKSIHNKKIIKSHIYGDGNANNKILKVLKTCDLNTKKFFYDL
tara:strand:- start:2626 stop:3780 length:1155 start_codon:yes stop_codon:yes gene_type:complete